MDFSFGKSKKNEAKSGRRAKSSAKSNSSFNFNTNEKESAVPKELTPAEDVIKQSPQRPSRKMGGWGDAGSRKDRDKPVEDSRLLISGEAPRTRIDLSDDEGSQDIQMIPDLDDVQGEDIMNKMAAPPSVAMNQVATYRELDSDLQRHSTFTLLDNEIDLKLLAKHMSPESETREIDETWNWDSLFTQVSSNLKSQEKTKTELQDNLI